MTTVEREAVLARLQAMAPKASVRFLKSTPDDTTPALHAADVAVVPSVYEEPLADGHRGPSDRPPRHRVRTGGIPGDPRRPSDQVSSSRRATPKPWRTSFAPPWAGSSESRNWPLHAGPG